MHLFLRKLCCCIVRRSFLRTSVILFCCGFDIFSVNALQVPGGNQVDGLRPAVHTVTGVIGPVRGEHRFHHHGVENV